MVEESLVVAPFTLIKVIDFHRLRNLGVAGLNKVLKVTVAAVAFRL